MEQLKEKRGGDGGQWTRSNNEKQQKILFIRRGKNKK